MVGGRIYEPYRGVYFDDTRETDIEHVIAKSEVHESGGCAWTRDERRAFANDLANLTLSAPRLNRFVKSNNDAAEWLPPLNLYWYAGTIVAVRVKYGLTIDATERDALEAILANCDSTEMAFTSQEWEIEAITFGDESGWQAVSPNELDNLRGGGGEPHRGVLHPHVRIGGFRFHLGRRALGGERAQRSDHPAALHLERVNDMARPAEPAAEDDHRSPVPALGDVDGSSRRRTAY